MADEEREFDEKDIEFIEKLANELFNGLVQNSDALDKVPLQTRMLLAAKHTAVQMAETCKKLRLVPTDMVEVALMAAMEVNVASQYTLSKLLEKRGIDNVARDLAEIMAKEERDG